MKRVEALDFTRVTAMLSVILIHTTSTFIYYKSNYTIGGMNLAFILNQWARFAVPLFLLISGISLNLSQRQEGVLLFWKRRLLKVEVPYLIWSLIYILYNSGFNLLRFANGIAEDPNHFIRTILLGQSAPHLYFIIILIQCYLLYPLLMKVLAISKFGTISFAFIVTFSIQSLYFFKRYQLDLIPNIIKPYLWLLFPTWAFYFILGAAISNDVLYEINAFARKHRYSIIVVTTIYSALFIIEANLTQSLDSIKQSLNTYVVLMLLCSFSLWKSIEKNSFFYRTVLFLSEHSMTIYFCHVLVLCYFRNYPFFSTGTLGMIFLFVIVLIFSTVLSLFIDILVSKFKKLKSTPNSSSKNGQ